MQTESENPVINMLKCEKQKKIAFRAETLYLQNSSVGHPLRLFVSFVKIYPMKSI